MKGALVFIWNRMLDINIGFLSITFENQHLNTIQKSRWKEIKENVITMKGSFLKEFPFHEIQWVELCMVIWKKSISCISY